jgi:hypothetical protein
MKALMPSVCSKTKKREFEDMAVGLLKFYDRNTRDVINDVLIIRYIPLFSMDCLELAVHCKCKEFLSTSVVQKVLTKICSGIDQTKIAQAELVN